MDDEDGWAAWCRANEFNIPSLDQSFCFTLPAARILTISAPRDLIPLPKIHPWEPRGASFMTTSFDPGMIYTPQWCYLDFEKLAKEYDAIELINSAELYFFLHTWDCNCILVMRKEVIMPLA